VRQVAAGSTDALAALYRLHAPSLFRLARRMTASVQDAEDALHDLFVGLPESLHKYDERGSLQGWLKRVLVRLVLMHHRAARRRREVDLPEEISVNRTPHRTEAHGTYNVPLRRCPKSCEPCSCSGKRNSTRIERSRGYSASHRVRPASAYPELSSS